MSIQVADIIFSLAILALLVYMLVMEKRRLFKFPFWIRWAASVTTSLSVVFLMFPISYTLKNEAWANDFRLHVFTKGTPVDSIVKLGKNALCFTTDSHLTQRYKVPYIHDWSAFIKRRAQAPITIYGTGLTEEQLKTIAGYPVTYHGIDVPDGFVVGNWQSRIRTSEELLIEGQYNNRRDQEVKVFIKSLSIVMDSVLINPDTQQVYQFKVKPKQLGSSMLELISVTGQDTLHTEKVPVQIDVPISPNILLLASSPSFEYKFLINWFQRLRYNVAYRARISREKFITSFTQHNPVSIPLHIEQHSLDQADLLIADEAELAILTVPEQQHIVRAVRAGMGLVLLGNAGTKHSIPGNYFNWREVDDREEKPVNDITSADGQPFPELFSNGISGLGFSEGQRGLLFAGKTILAATQPLGSGHVTAMTINSSHQWRLAGKEEAYTRLWSALANSTLRNKEEPADFSQSPAYPSLYHWSSIVFRSAAEPDPTINDHVYATFQHDWTPFEHRITFWPRHKGWNVLHLNTADSIRFYVYDNVDWEEAKDYATMKANKHLAQINEHALRSDGSNSANYTKKQIPKWPFFISFLGAMSLLWYSSREYN